MEYYYQRDHTESNGNDKDLSSILGDSNMFGTGRN